MTDRFLLIDYGAVYLAWERFRKGKKPTRLIDKFAYSHEQNVMNLSQMLRDRSYCHGAYEAVVVEEKKRRDLAVAGVHDRVVHRLLYDYLALKFDPGFDSDVWSCRQGKGLHKCLKRTQKLLAKHPNSYVWRADIKKFFDNVDHVRLIDCLKRKIGDDEQAIWLCQEVISSYAVREQRAESREQRAESREQRAESRYSDWQSDQSNIFEYLLARI